MDYKDFENMADSIVSGKAKMACTNMPEVADFWASLVVKHNSSTKILFVDDEGIEHEFRDVEINDLYNPSLN